MTSPLRPLLLAAALTVPGLAQEATTTAATSRPLLVVRSIDESTIATFAEMLGVGDDPPDLADGSHYEVVLDRDRHTTMTTASGTSNLLEITADPAGLMTAFVDEIRPARIAFQGGLGVVLSQSGMKTKDAAAIVKAVFDFPNQFERVELAVIGNPRFVQQKGLDVTVDLVAAAGSPFGAAMGMVRPCSLGAPTLDEDAPLRCRVSLDPASTHDLVAPLAGSFASTATGTVLQRLLELEDGGSAMAFDARGNLQWLIGATDGGKLADLVNSDYLAFLKAESEASRSLEMTVQPNALEVRGSRFHRLSIESDADNPLVSDGKMSVFTGVVGNWMVMTSSAAAVDTLAATAAATKRSALPNGAVLTMDFSFEKLGQVLGREPPEGMPKQFHLALLPSAKGLAIRAHVR